jgi:aerobic carbon-monoxide dehydrogenase medium subunit
MKAAAFSYARATSITDALQLLARHGDDAKVLSGGQSLMPALNLRLSRPAILVDIGRLSELRGVTVAGGKVTIGALTRHVDLLGSREVAEKLPLLREATAHVAHPAIRNRGTIGGNLAHADPASELPACMLALDATLVIRGIEHERRIVAQDFFQGIYATALAADELLTAVEVPLPAPGARHFFHEYARRSGDYAMVGLAATARTDAGRLRDLRLGYFAVGDRPQLVRAAARLVGVDLTPDLVAAAKAELMCELDPASDQQASAAMRRHLAGLLLESCVATVLERPDLVPEQRS